MVIRCKEFYFDGDERGLVRTSDRQADEQLIGKTGRGNAPRSSAEKKRKTFQIFSRDRGGEVSKVEKVGTGDEEKSAGVKALEWDQVKLKKRFQEQQAHKSKKCDQPVSPPPLKNNHGTRDIYIDDSPRKSAVIPGYKGDIKERSGEEKTNKYVVSSPHGGSNEILYSKESPCNQKKNETERSSILVLRTRLHCDDCIRKIQKCISKYKGVESVAIDTSKDEVSVTGVVEMKKFVPFLKDKINRDVEVVSTRKKGDKEIKDKVNMGRLGDAGDHGKKKEQTPVIENVNQRDNHWSLPHPITYSNDGEIHSWNYGTDAYQSYMNQGASYQRFNQLYAPDIFSDENPNACSIM